MVLNNLGKKIRMVQMKRHCRSRDCFRESFKCMFSKLEIFNRAI